MIFETNVIMTTAWLILCLGALFLFYLYGGVQIIFYALLTLAIALSYAWGDAVLVMACGIMLTSLIIIAWARHQTGRAVFMISKPPSSLSRAIFVIAITILSTGSVSAILIILNKST